MEIKLITGLRETEDIQSQDDGARIYGTISSCDRVLEVGEKFAYQIISNNCVRIKSGELLMQGRHARQAPNTYTDLTISNSTQNMQRNDLIVARYTKDSNTGIENVELAIVEGTPGSIGVDPEITTGDIFEGCTLHEKPLYRVKMNGLNISSITTLFSQISKFDGHTHSVDELTSGTMPISRGGTGATTAISAISNFKAEIVNLIYPVGSILMTIKSANPSTYLGGTWIRWGAGKVPVGVDTSDTNFSTVEKTGGSKTHTLTAMEMPQHTHEYYHEGAGAILVRTDEHQSNVVNWGQTTKSTGIAGGNSAHNNLQPYITCYMWKRTT